MVPERRGENRPFASLTSGLLARKGQAKPAMKPQGYTMMSGNLDDLGWNDMGLSSPPPRTTPVAVTLPEPEPVFVHEMQPEPLPIAAVIREREEIAEALDPVVETVVPITQVKRKKTPAIVATPEPTSRAKPGGKAKAAFTLRLDPDRHLRLRLACAMGNRSAQAIVTEALDAYLSEIPEMDVLAASARRN